MNKKNIAIAMSGLTVLASAAPVFADQITVDGSYTTVQKDYKTTLKKIQEGILNKSIKAIKISYDGREVSNFTPTSDLSASSEQFYNLVEPQLKNMDDGDLVEFAISYDMSTKTYSEKELNALAETLGNQVVVRKATKTSAGVVEQSTEDNAKVVAGDRNLVASDFYKFNVEPITPATLSDGYKLTVTAKDITTLTAKYKYAANTEANFSSVSEFKTATPSVELVTGKKLDSVKTFELDTTTEANKAIIGDLALESSSDFNEGTMTVKVINATETTIDVDSKSSTSAEDLAKKYVFKESDLNGILRVLNTTKGYDDEIVQLVNGKYQTVVYPEGKRLETKGGEETAPVKLIIKSDKVKDLKDYIDDLKTYNNSYSNVVTVAGEDRIETAIELSNKYYNSDDTHAISSKAADNIVLVGSQAIVDGLVASPLASEKHAPLLLTSKDKLDSNLKSEIKRVMDLKSTTGINTTKKVYLAGGVNSISKDVENELKNMGLKVTRLAGDDRYETSLAIADEIGLDNDKAFVVGGTGLADAMSIAPVASQLKDSNGKLDATNGDATPIVVVDGKAKDINAATEDFLDNAQVDIIGGENSVSKDIEEAIDDATGKEPNRTSGDDRQATNAEVMKETDYFEKASVENYFVAKDGSTKEDQLVDALAAAPVAANFGSTYDGKVANGTVSPAPIVLATDSLSSDQNVGVSKSVSDDGGKNLVQVGKGIASSVMNKMKDLLDM
ncbi:S-layer protein SlpA [Clostridioides difficile]|uniref:S-layer protein SlpA n=1 Tax=Clostridioides difficile TaxID=1496 RepID=UPI0021C2EBF9|nr:S-layer protein SlpA [Clostridioides difficile]UUC41492.1 S-layer protein SlpA [Clostridioides difficile]